MNPCFRRVSGAGRRGLAGFGLLLAALAVATMLLSQSPAAAQDAVADYDADGDGLIDVGKLEQLSAIRWDLDGDGAPEPANAADYQAAFPSPVPGMGCPDTDSAPDTPNCIGYELAGDLDFQDDSSYTTASNKTGWTPGISIFSPSAGWEPIGADTGKFSAAFKGNGRIISNLYINRPATDYIGLFGAIDASAEVNGVRLSGGTVLGQNYTGSLAGSNEGKVSESHSTTGVTGGADGGHAGGLVGLSSGSGALIEKSAYLGRVSGSGNGVNVGGLAGAAMGGAVSDSHAAGSVTSTESAGDAAIGGLIGHLGEEGGSSATVSRSYATGLVTAAVTTGTASVGGLIGSVAADAAAVDSYWDTATAAQAASAAGGGKTTAELQTPTTAGGIYQNWDANVWDFGTTAQYPALKVDSNGDGMAGVAELGPQVRAFADYDVDDDGLIEVATLDQLNALRWDLDGDGTTTAAGYVETFPSGINDMGCPTAGCTGYELTRSLDFDDAASYGDQSNKSKWTSGRGWLPIGDSSAGNFAATFHGGGNTISNLFIDRPEVEYVGLFGNTHRDTEIRNVGLIGGRVIGGFYVGALVAHNQGALSAAYSTANVIGVGKTTYVTKSEAGLRVRTPAGKTSYVGGLVGANSGAIESSYAQGDVTAESIERGTAGGLVGSNNRTVTDSYATGTVTVEASELVIAGGLIGLNHRAIVNSYATGAVVGAGFKVGGLVGHGNGAAANSYWDTVTSGRAASRMGEGKTTRELRTPTTHAGIYANWNADTDNADNDGDTATGREVVWDFGTNIQYPALALDFDGDGNVTAAEFNARGAQPPVEFLDGTAAPRSVLEDTPAAQDIGAPVDAVDADGDALTYTMNGADAGHFTIDANTGQLQTRDPVDYETTSSYSLTVTASDGSGNTKDIPVTIQVIDDAIDYDTDDDGLIEIDTLTELHAIRWDLSGNGLPAPAHAALYLATFPNPVIYMGCPTDDTTDANGDGNYVDRTDDADPNDCTGYELTADLDFDENGDKAITDADSAWWNGGSGWEPIGGGDDKFGGVFDGGGNTIANLYINRSSADDIGLFGATDTTAEIRNVGLEGGSVTGQTNVGSLVGTHEGKLSSVYSTASVSGAAENGYAGGLVGALKNSNVGLHHAIIEKSYFAGEAAAAGSGSAVGGLAGGNLGDHIGGLIRDSYSTGTVSNNETTGPSMAGGLVGNNLGKISTSYATGVVTGAFAVGGLTGRNTGVIVSFTPSFYDKITTGQSGGPEAKTTREMRTPFGTSWSDKGIFRSWSRSWDLGTNIEYPALMADYDGDGMATWQEFGDQRQPAPPLEFLDGTAAFRTVPEGAASGQAIDPPVDAKDADGDALTYALSGADQGHFAIVAGSGQLQTSGSLDRAVKTSYEVTVTVADGNGNSRSIPVSITVTAPLVAPNPRNKPPAFSRRGDSRNIAENVPQDTAVGAPVVAVDPDGDTLTYTLRPLQADAHAEYFSIAFDTGQLRTNAPLDYETRNSYLMFVTATDGNGATDTVRIYVYVNDVTVEGQLPDEIVGDYDRDNDGLIEITNLEQLDAIRYDLNGSGIGDGGAGKAGFNPAFPNPVASIGPAHIGCARSDGTASVCRGFELTRDLDFNDDESYADPAAHREAWTSGAGWQPIGTLSRAFTAIFEGNGKTISNLFINRPTGTHIGLFGRLTKTSPIRRLGLVGGSVTGLTNVGSFAGSSQRTYRPSQPNNGGIYKSYSSVDVTGGPGFEARVGGMIGLLHEGRVMEKCYYTGTVRGSGANSEVGGLVGASNGSVNDCYFAGDVENTQDSANNLLGGLVGKNLVAAAIRDSYSIGRTAQSTVSDSGGGLTGHNDSASVHNSYWNTETTGQAVSRKGAGDGAGEGKTTAELQLPTGLTGPYERWNNEHRGAVWDFGADDQYPALVVDFDGDGTPTVSEFGRQRRAVEAANGPPTFDEGATATREVVENTDADAAIGNPLSATDPDAGASLTYGLEASDDHVHFAIDTATGQLKTKAGVTYDYETKDTYTVTVTVHNGKNAAGAADATVDDTIDVTINVTDASERWTPPTGLTIDGRAEPGTLKVRWTAPAAADNTGKPALTGYKVQWRQKLNAILPWAPDWIDFPHTGLGVTAVITGSTATDGTVYTITGRSGSRISAVRVCSLNTDGAKHTEDPKVEQCGAWIGNAVPAFAEPITASRSVAENSPPNTNIGPPVVAVDTDAGDTLVYSLIKLTKETHSARFTIDSATGQLKTKAPLDHEGVKNSYLLEVNVSDGNNGANSILVLITVTDVNEPPEFMSAAYTDPDGNPVLPAPIATATRSFREDAAADAAIGGPVAATDPDTKADPRDTLTYALDTSSGDHASFTIDTATGQLKTKAGVTYNYEAVKNSYTVTVQVRDSKNANGDADTAWDATIEVTITVTDVNEPPTFTDGVSKRISVKEGATSAGIVAATDPEDDMLTYALDTTTGDHADFTIVPGTGALTLNVPASFSKLSYTVVIQVRDSLNAAGAGDTVWDATIEVTITVTNVNDPPTFNEGPTATREVAENTVAETAIGNPIAATEVDTRDTLVYSLAATSDYAHFAIDTGTGQLKTGGALNYEAAKNTYTVTVQVSDGKDADDNPDVSVDDSIAVTITVTDVNEPPDRPSTPTVSAASASSLTVRWSAPANTGPAITGYDYRYKKTSENSWIEVTGGSASALLTAVIASLDGGTSYDVQVRATNPEGTGRWSPTTSATTGTVAPEAVDDLAATATSASAINLAWTAPGDGGSAITRYRLERKTGGGSFSPVSSSIAADATSHTDSGLNAGTTYTYRIRAVNAVGNGGWSSEASATTGSTMPGAPTSLGAAANGQTQIDLSWTAPSSDGGAAISGYKIEVSDDGGTSWANLVTNTSSAATTYRHTGLTADATRHYRVSAINAAGTGAASSAASATTAAPDVPGAPTGLGATANGQTRINLTWTAPGDGGSAITRYRLERKTASGSYSVVSSSIAANATSYADSSLSAGTAYTYRIRAVNAVGNGGWSNEASATTGNVAPPPPVTPPGGGGGGGGIGGGAPANQGPVFIDRPKASRSVPEGTSEGASFGDPVAATDLDNDALTYTLRGGDADSFDIDRQTGQLLVKAALDYETKASYSLRARVSDGEGGSDLIDLTVMVTDVDEPPAIAGPVATEYEENSVEAIAAYTAMDPEGTEVTWSLGGDDAGAFTVSGAGVLAFNAPPDYEAPADADTDNVYQVMLQATDLKGMMGMLHMVVSVTDVENEGIWTRYDFNNNGLIERGEALAAVFDYFADLITKQQALGVVFRYFAS